MESAGDKSSDPTIKHPKSFPIFSNSSSSKLNAEYPKTKQKIHTENLHHEVSNWFV